ncbi:hypothetical protein GCM10009804_71240 [Kribbella hippodromi]|uniref:Uncharacterized protein n=1 Tax=Kribbella hippodromi TaxID=434347 RepID=A0ABN2EGP6_9ACTN
MDEPDNLWVGLGYVQVDGDLKAAFIVDARRYADAGAAREVIRDAGAELRRRGIAGQFEMREIRADQPLPFDLPTWDEYLSQQLDD